MLDIVQLIPAELNDISFGKIKDILSFLKRFGYIKSLDDITIADVIRAIKKFREWYHLPDSELIDGQVLSAMNTPRCGCPDIERINVLESKWKNTNLSYHVHSYVDGLDRNTQLELIQRAWDSWSEHTNITLTPTNNLNSANIVISTGRGRRYNFDGSSGTLAWAYLPNGNDSQLLMRFDLDETWISNPRDRGILYLNVAAHEFGHLLGLDHSKVSSALMAPYYNPSIAVPQSRDDISRIQGLYGVKTPVPVPPISPTPIPPTNEDVHIIVEGQIEKISIPGYRVSKIG